MTVRPSRIVLDGPLIVGGGAAGLSAALAAAPRRTVLATAAPLGEACATAWAQGGIAAALGPDDNPVLHAADTVAAGAGLVAEDSALRLAEAAPAAIARLIEAGAPFDRDAAGHLVLGLEAAHRRPRIARVGGDSAGRAVMSALASAVARSEHVEVWSGARMLALLQDGEGRVRGALVARGGSLVEAVAPVVMLSTGGIGGLYAVTTNPSALKGEGLAAAALAGAEIADPEFVQFHPTALDVGLDPAPLATEALRGDGAILVNRDGRRFIADVHPAAELAPRDLVARAVFAEIAAGRGAFLDARAAVGAAFPDRFPAVFAACMRAGIDPRRELIPVAPAAHYHMGGIAASPEGRTSLEGLLSSGECASTGAHGANRLASNSLLEGVAFGTLAGETAREAEAAQTAPLAVLPPPDLPADALHSLRRAMSRDAGVIRSGPGLARLVAEIGILEADHGLALPIIAARMVAEAALDREESRGGHFRSDFPAPVEPARRTRLFWTAGGADPVRIAAE